MDYDGMENSISSFQQKTDKLSVRVYYYYYLVKYKNNNKEVINWSIQRRKA